MDVFDSMEPWRQAEQLAADADFREAALPKCARCGCPITDSKLVYIPAHDEFYCLDCIACTLFQLLGLLIIFFSSLLV